MITFAFAAMIFRAAYPAGSYTHYYDLGMTIPGALCTTFISGILLVLISLTQGLHKSYVLVWDKMEKDLEYYRKRSHELSDHLQDIVVTLDCHAQK